MDVFVYFNTHPNHFQGYEHGHPLKKVFNYEAPEEGKPRTLADQAFRAFNAPPELIPVAYQEIVHNYRTVGLRSLSVGDALRIGETWLACAATDWIELEQAPRIEPVPDAPVDLLVVTPAGDVQDYVVEADAGGLVTSRGILEALYDQIGCTHVDVVALSPEIDLWVDDEGALKPTFASTNWPPTSPPDTVCRSSCTSAPSYSAVAQMPEVTPPFSASRHATGSWP